MLNFDKKRQTKLSSALALRETANNDREPQRRVRCGFFLSLYFLTLFIVKAVMCDEVFHGSRSENLKRQKKNKENCVDHH